MVAGLPEFIEFMQKIESRLELLETKTDDISSVSAVVQDITVLKDTIGSAHEQIGNLDKKIDDVEMLVKLVEKNIKK